MFGVSKSERENIKADEEKAFQRWPHWARMVILWR
jgi:hypothetical protein